MIDMGGRFRLLVNEVEAVPLEGPMPRLPVERVLWKPMLDLKTAASAWILAGGAHHTGYSECLTPEYVQDLNTQSKDKMLSLKMEGDINIAQVS